MCYINNLCNVTVYKVYKNPDNGYIKQKRITIYFVDTLSRYTSYNMTFV